MIIGDENDLRERLDRAFGPVTASPAPIEDAVRTGKVIRRRRRAGAVAVLAAVVTLAAVAVPLSQHATRAASPASARYTVTVHAPSPNAPAGAIAYGTVNGQWWELVASQPGTEGAGHGQQLITASGAAFGTDGPVSETQPALAPDGTDPAALTGLRSAATQAQFGAVAANVSYLTVRLGNGIVLTLHPVTVFGVRVVAFAVPAGAEIVSAAAYSEHGEISTAVPFTDASEVAYFGLWLKPGRPQPARFSGRIGSGTFDGKTWSATAHVGPWGLCAEGTGGGTSGSSCVPVTSGLGTSVMFWTAGTPEVALGSAAARVTRLVVTQPGGTTEQVRVVKVGGQKFFAFAMSAGHKKVRWAAYDSSGGLVASSSLIPDSGEA